MDFNEATTAILNLIAECDSDADYFAKRLRREQIPHISFSQVITIEACPYRYYLQYILGMEPFPTPDYFVKGKLLHQLIAQDYRNGNQLLFYENEITQRFIGESAAHLLNAMMIHRQHAWRNFGVVAVEKPFVFHPDPSLPPLVGVIDLILEQDGAFLLVDHKTGRNFYPNDELQVAIYAQYISSAYEVQSCRMFYDHYRWVNNLDRIRKPAFQRLEVYADLLNWPQHLARIRCAYSSIEKIHASGHAPRTGECFLCPYKEMC